MAHRRRAREGGPAAVWLAVALLLGGCLGGSSHPKASDAATDPASAAGEPGSTGGSPDASPPRGPGVPPPGAAAPPGPGGNASDPDPYASLRARLRAAPRPELVPPQFRTPQKLASPLAIGGGPEPSILATADGAVYITFLDVPIGLFRSDDGGASYQELDGSDLDGPGDAALAESAPGALHWAGLGGFPAPTVLVQTSKTKGANWTTPFRAAGDHTADRQWLDGLPDGTVLVTWTDRGTGPTPQINLAARTSADAGATWGPVTFVEAGNSPTGPPVHDPLDGTFYLPYVGRQGLVVAASADGGAHWTIHPVLPRLPTALIFDTTIFPVAAVDAAGTVYLAWSTTLSSVVPGLPKELNAQAVFLSHSLDGGRNWTTPRVLSPPGRTAIFPWISAGAAGRVVVTWYESEHGLSELAPDLWHVTLLESVTADRPNATFLGGRLNAQPAHIGQICAAGVICSVADRSRGDFFSNAIKPDGQPVVSWVADSAVPGATADVYAGGVLRGTPLR